MERLVQLSEVPIGGVFSVGGVDFFRFKENNRITPAVTKEVVFDSIFGENNNNLHESIVLERLQNEFLPNILQAVGSKNVHEFATQLVALDGLRPYDTLKSKVALPNLEFYRANVKVFDMNRLDKWWWLANPFSAQPHGSPLSVLCVSPQGSSTATATAALAAFVRFYTFHLLSLY